MNYQANPKIAAIKELRQACDVTLKHARDALEQYVAVHPGVTWHDAAIDLASVLPKRPPTIDAELASLRARLASAEGGRDAARVSLATLAEAAEAVRAEYNTTMEIENVSGKTFARRMRWCVGHLTTTRELVLRDAARDALEETRD